MTTIAAGAIDTYIFGDNLTVLSVRPSPLGRLQVTVLRNGIVVFGDNVTTPRTIGPFRTGDIVKLAAITGPTDYETVTSSNGVVVVNAAEKFGIVGNTGVDMTSRLSTALNAAFNEGYELLLPYGDINISGEIVVSASQAQTYTVLGATPNWRKPVAVRGYGPLATNIIQNQAGARHFYYLPTSGNIAHARFSDFCLSNATPSYTNINQAGIQIGGGAVDLVGENITLHNVSGRGLYSVLRVDDLTGLTVSGSFQNGLFRYYCEGGYNSDFFHFSNFESSFDHPQDVVCSSSTGTTISGINAAITAYIYPGMGITGQGIPADTTILTVGVTSLTTSNAVTAVTSFSTHLGTMLSLLGNDGTAYSGSGFATVANAANYFNKTRASNPNVITFEKVLFNRAQNLVEDYGNAYNLAIKQCYMERPQSIALLGTNSTGANSGIAIDGIMVSQPQTLRQPLIKIQAQEPRGYIRNVVTDGTPNNTRTVYMPNLSSNTNSSNLAIENCFGQAEAANSPPMNIQQPVRFGGNQCTGQYTFAGTANPTMDWIGVRRMIVTAPGGNVGIQNPGSVYPADNQEIEIVVVADGAITVAYAPAWVNADGSAISTSAAASGAGKVYVARFIKVQGAARMKLINAPAWG